MRVFYYQYEGQTWLVCVPGVTNAGRLSPIWRCNTCSWLVPGTFADQPDDDDEL